MKKNIMNVFFYMFWFDFSLKKMHGRKKVPIDEAKKIKLQKKCKIIEAQYNEVMEAKKDPSKIENLINTKTPLLNYLSDFATLWNMRKEYFKDHANEEQLKIELEISQNCIKENPKSYWAFHHRRWCYEYMDIKDVSREIDLCGMLLAVDARNFHAWRHRRWAVQRCGDQYEKELKHTYDLIASNFSNYSAWHYRSQLPNLTDFKGEIEMAKTAMWTDPRDQSAWIYYRWLLNRPEIASDQELLHEELQTLKELQEEEPNCKYIYLAQLWIQRKIEDSNEEEIKKLIEKLSELDPIRAPYYKEL